MKYYNWFEEENDKMIYKHQFDNLNDAINYYNKIHKTLDSKMKIIITERDSNSNDIMFFIRAIKRPLDNQLRII